MVYFPLRLRIVTEGGAAIFGELRATNRGLWIGEGENVEDERVDERLRMTRDGSWDYVVRQMGRTAKSNAN
jgi:hypothetical protein